MAGSRFAGVLDEPRRRVDADGSATWRDQCRQPLGRVAEAAADVEHALARTRAEQLDGRAAVRREAPFDQLLKAQEAVEERPVPGLDRLLVRRVCRGLLLDACHPRPPLARWSRDAASAAAPIPR